MTKAFEWKRNGSGWRKARLCVERSKWQRREPRQPAAAPPPPSRVQRRSTSHGGGRSPRPGRASGVDRPRRPLVRRPRHPRSGRPPSVGRRVLRLAPPGAAPAPAPAPGRYSPHTAYRILRPARQRRPGRATGGCALHVRTSALYPPLIVRFRYSVGPSVVPVASPHRSSPPNCVVTVV